MENVIKSHDGSIELCMSDVKKSGRAKIKMSALAICNSDEYNKNGITWIEEYVEANKESAVGMDYVVSFLDGDDGVPSGHGDMQHDEDGNVIFENSVVIGHTEEVAIEDIEVDGETKRLFVTYGYINVQRYPKFYQWLKDEIESGRACGSIEINGKAGASKIKYLNDKSLNDDGTPYFGRIPVEFDFTALAILCKEIETPADDLSICFEVNTLKNSREGEEKNMAKVIKKSQTIEMNKLSYYDIEGLVTRAINKAMSTRWEYYIHKFYPETNEIIFKNWDDIGKYYMTTYSVTSNEVTIGDIQEVEEDWKPVTNIQEVETNSEKIRKNLMNEKGDLEMNQELFDAKIAELNTQISNVTTQITELNSVVAEKDSKIAELNEVVVEANKKQEELNVKMEEVEKELNGYKDKVVEYESKEAEIEENRKKDEVESYMKDEISKNGFTAEEINSFKELVDGCDLVGIKTLEAELCTAKFKSELSQKETKKEESNIETNSISMFRTKEKEKKVISDEIPSFFK